MSSVTDYIDIERMEFVAKKSTTYKNESLVYKHLQKCKISTSYSCNQYFCDFSDTINSINIVNNHDIDSMISEHDRKAAASVFFNYINQNRDCLKPGELTGIYLYFLNTPLLYTKNLNILKSNEESYVACIDLDKVFLHTYTTVRNKKFSVIGAQGMFVSGISSIGISSYFLYKQSLKSFFGFGGVGIGLCGLSYMYLKS